MDFTTAGSLKNLTEFLFNIQILMDTRGCLKKVGNVLNVF